MSRETKDQKLERLARAVLDDDHGISEETFILLTELLGKNHPMFHEVDACDGRFYIAKE